ncbi:MAG: hypothetical protein AVDCRST_MAG69-2081, partial [uncultured Solirubrobacteraceae bacterium]
ADAPKPRRARGRLRRGVGRGSRAPGGAAAQHPRALAPPQPRARAPARVDPLRPGAADPAHHRRGGDSGDVRDPLLRDGSGL